MQLNATDLKVSPLLATPDEAKRGQRGLMLAQCVGVSGAPNEARVAPFPASTVGVNEANQGQMGPGINPPPPPSFPRRQSDPFSLEGRRRRMRVKPQPQSTVGNGTKWNEMEQI